MATNARLPQRRIGTQRVKADENAMTRHLRQPSNASASRFPGKENAIKATSGRQALGEVTTAAVNRKDTAVKQRIVVGKDHATSSGKEKEEVSLKRGRSNSTTVAQRVPLGPRRVQPAPPVANVIPARAPAARTVVRLPVISGTKRNSRTSNVEQQFLQEIQEYHDEQEVRMDVEEDIAALQRELEDNDVLLQHEQEVAAMVGIEDSEEEDESEQSRQAKRQRTWPEIATDRRLRYEAELQSVRDNFEDEVDEFKYDPTMVSEYADDIFEYMCDLEEDVMPDPDYIKGQNELSWTMRQTLVDWLLQVHLRYHMLPETLWIAINIVDRFLSKRVVSLVKLQLVGVTAMFIACKYEEIMAPSVDEFVFMTENGYTKDEILKGERIMLQTLDFRISNYCSPYSWMRKISKADTYNIHTRTLSKFLTEVTLLDYRFLRVKPSMVAAVGMYSARRMLGGDWNDAFVYHSGYTEEQLLPGHEFLMEKLVEANFDRQYVCRKYTHKKFLKASAFAIGWARLYGGKSAEDMMLEH